MPYSQESTFRAAAATYLPHCTFQKTQTLMPGCSHVSLLPFLLCDVTVLLRTVLSGTDTSGCSCYAHVNDMHCQTLMPSCHTSSVMPWLFVLHTFRKYHKHLHFLSYGHFLNLQHILNVYHLYVGCISLKTCRPKERITNNDLLLTNNNE